MCNAKLWYTVNPSLQGCLVPSVQCTPLLSGSKYCLVQLALLKYAHFQMYCWPASPERGALLRAVAVPCPQWGRRKWTVEGHPLRWLFNFVLPKHKKKSTEVHAVA